jgi:large subunit ribosomal protein L21
MYAVIRVGTSQERVSEGQVVRVDRRPEQVGSEVQFVPVLLVDGDQVVAGPALKGATVTATILGEEKGPKIRALTYKPKANQRKRWGHRQKYSSVQITSIAAKAAPKRATKSTRAVAKTVPEAAPEVAAEPTASAEAES